jgi:hypothetical protein
LTACELLADLRQRGFTLSLSMNGKPQITPFSLVSAEDLEALKANRVELIELLKEESAVVDDQPVPPRGARIYLCRKDCAECEPGDEVYMWCWEGGPRWYYARTHPAPIQPKPVRKRIKAEQSETLLEESS